MTTLFISDLHLDDARPDATALFRDFVREEARSAEALYILGDLFEYWVGDDAPGETGTQVAESLAGLSGDGVPVWFMHGNRDFLIGDDYARRCGMQLLPEYQVIDLYGEPTLLLHGDTLCTDDTVYQEVRSTLRSAQWQAEFLAQPVAERIAFARDAMSQSADHKLSVSMEIMDVNPDAVAEAFARHRVSNMIHGHTHRPAVHELLLDSGPARRTVLGDWYEQGSVLRVDARGAVLAQL
ncbi:MAG: UDP-2,3-diacylglucosamine diphosphatase [Xanthomonadales bacterium]|nr:UDP-2,3-diacylglucosamine diphosphatase [Xanthomonadales bacterium]